MALSDSRQSEVYVDDVIHDYNRSEIGRLTTERDHYKRALERIARSPSHDYLAMKRYARKALDDA